MFLTTIKVLGELAIELPLLAVFDAPTVEGISRAAQDRPGEDSAKVPL